MNQHDVVNFIINVSNNEFVAASREFCNDHPILLVSLLGAGFIWAISDEIMGDLRAVRAHFAKH